MQPRNWAEISRAALRHNWRALRARVPPASAICAVVKADAYGHGAAACALEFERLGAGWLAVTSPEEGARLRQAGVQARILVLAGFAPEEAAALVAHRLTPAIWNAEQIAWLAAAAPSAFPIHLKLESGMGRLGITPDQEAAVAAALRRAPRLQVEAVFSHLASSEAADPAPSEAQFAHFRQAAARLGFADTPWHLLNSEGALRFPQWSGMLVRAGLALYGYSADAAYEVGLRPALAWKTRILSLKDLPAGHGVGYGARYRTAAPARLAVIAAGYADGYRRDFFPGGRVRIGAADAPLVGAVSMDLAAVDVTRLPASLGDEVTLLGSGVSARDLAALARTLPYEILCGLSARVERRYVD